MDKPLREPWFSAKKYGWGWGWLMVALWRVAIIVGSIMFIPERVS